MNQTAVDEELARSRGLLPRQCASVIKDLTVMIAANLSALVSLCVVTEGPAHCRATFQRACVTMVLLEGRVSSVYLNLLDLNARNALRTILDGPSAAMFIVSMATGQDKAGKFARAIMTQT